MVRSAQILCLTILLSVTVLGCSSETSRYAATGTVTMDGAPAPLVIVRFHPVVPDTSPGGSGPTDEAGKFTLGENGKNTGLPSGEYKVTFSQTLVKGKPTLAGSGGKKAEREATEKEAVADEYCDLQKTPVTATIGSGSNNFTFDIKAKKK
jgi:hypothetical protein